MTDACMQKPLSGLLVERITIERGSLKTISISKRRNVINMISLEMLVGSSLTIIEGSRIFR